VQRGVPVSVVRGADPQGPAERDRGRGRCVRSLTLFSMCTLKGVCSRVRDPPALVAPAGDEGPCAARPCHDCGRERVLLRQDAAGAPRMRSRGAGLFTCTACRFASVSNCPCTSQLACYTCLLLLVPGTRENDALNLGPRSVDETSMHSKRRQVYKR
jgi:hypothetical protein